MTKEINRYYLSYSVYDSIKYTLTTCIPQVEWVSIDIKTLRQNNTTYRSHNTGANKLRWS